MVNIENFKEYRGIILALDRCEGENEMYINIFSHYMFGVDENFLNDRTKIIILNHSYRGDFSDDVYTPYWEDDPENCIVKYPPTIASVFQEIKTAILSKRRPPISHFVVKDYQVQHEQEQAFGIFYAENEAKNPLAVVIYYRNTVLCLYRQNLPKEDLVKEDQLKIYRMIIDVLTNTQFKYTQFLLDVNMQIYQGSKIKPEEKSSKISTPATKRIRLKVKTIPKT